MQADENLFGDNIDYSICEYFEPTSLVCFPLKNTKLSDLVPIIPGAISAKRLGRSAAVKIFFSDELLQQAALLFSIELPNGTLRFLSSHHSHCRNCLYNAHTKCSTPPKCMKCGEVGHLKADCPSSIKCFICKSTEHDFHSCPTQKAINENRHLAALLTARTIINVKATKQDFIFQFDDASLSPSNKLNNLREENFLQVNGYGAYILAPSPFIIRIGRTVKEMT